MKGSDYIYSYYLVPELVGKTPAASFMLRWKNVG